MDAEFGVVCGFAYKFFIFIEIYEKLDQVKLKMKIFPFL